MHKLVLALACATALAACAFEPGGEALPDATGSQTDAALQADAGAGNDAAQPTPDAPPAPIDAAPTPDAPMPVVHEIRCANSNGVTITLTGNIKTGLVDAAPSGTPSYVAYGSDSGGAPWPSSPNASASVGNVTVTDGGATWTLGAFSFGDSVQGFTPYVVVNGTIKWFDLPNRWTIPADQYCTKNTAGDKICTCDSLPCTPSNESVPGTCN